MKKSKKCLMLVAFAIVALPFIIPPFAKISAASPSSENSKEAQTISLADFAPDNILKKNKQTEKNNVKNGADLLRTDLPTFPPGTNIVIEEAGAGETLSTWGYQLVEKLLGEGVDIDKDSVVINKGAIKTGTINGLGMFTNGEHATEIDEGVILSTGKVSDIPGPNESSRTSTVLSQDSPSGDDDLQLLLPKPPGNEPDPRVTETTSIEFDFVPKGRKLVFDYVFASDEYQEWVPQPYNDVFGFFINKGTPNPGNKKNIALLPDGRTPVSIKSINKGANPTYYRNNDRHRQPFPLPGEEHINIEYDGLTTMLTAESVVEPGEKHHIKLIVGDVQDRLVDSSVFIRANSFSSKYTVAYHAGGATGQVPYAEDVTLFDPHTVLAPKDLEYPGHKFLGWYSDFHDKIFQPDDVFKVEDVTNLTARWEELKYTVTYDLNEGIGKTPAPVEYGENAEVTIANDDEFARPGYYFTGWKSSVDDQIYKPGAKFKIKENVKFTAQWLGTPVISADFEIAPKEIKQTQRTKMTSTFENTGELPTEWTNVVYETTAFPVGVTPDLTTLEVNGLPYAGTPVLNPTTRVLKLEFPKIESQTVITYDAVAAKDAPVGTTTMSYTVKGKEGELKKSNDDTLKITQNTVTMTVKFTLEDGVKPVKDINTGLPIADKTVENLEVGSVFDVTKYKEDIAGFIYQSVENPANNQVPDTNFTVIFKYKGDLSFMAVSPTVDFGENSLITFNHRDIWPLNPLTVDIMDTRESPIDWELSLALEDSFKNSADDSFIGEIRFVDKAGNDEELTKTPLKIQTREQEVLGKTSITWDKKNEGIYLRQFPGNTNDTYTGVLLWSLTDGL